MPHAPPFFFTSPFDGRFQSKMSLSCLLSISIVVEAFQGRLCLLCVVDWIVIDTTGHLSAPSVVAFVDSSAFATSSPEVNVH